MPRNPMRRILPALAVILTVATGCDNVSWGGAEVSLEAPPTRAEIVAADPDLSASPAEDSLPELPDGPILLAGRRSGSRATLAVVGEVQVDAIGELPDEASEPGFRDYFVSQMLAPGSEWILFSEGVRVGRMTATENGLDESFCVPRPTVTGTVELVPEAANAKKFMALPSAVARGRPYGSYRALRHNYDQRVASLALAQSALPRVNAPWPPSLLEARGDIQAFRLVGADGASIAATFLYQDRLQVEPARQGAYALFLMGSEADGAYRPSYVWYRSVASDGKGAPRFFDHLDWDGDGNEEVLLEVLGSQSRWFAGLAQRSGSWVRTSQDACGSTTPPTTG
jgi:hypothetical protein